jgi:TetR/AcrR family transcriptional regulator, regulator of cefoperazone and chloramphenicol sensitivity
MGDLYARGHARSGTPWPSPPSGRPMTGTDRRAPRNRADGHPHPLARVEAIDGADVAETLSEAGGDTKEQLMLAAAHLFARRGIDGTHIREINRMTGQRNPSAIHYHFGSKEGLVRAILVRHQAVVEVEAAQRLDELLAGDGEPSVRDLLEAMVRPLCRQLEDASGRDFLRIVPSFIVELVANLRVGVTSPVTSESARLLALIEGKLGHFPEVVRRERLVTYTLVLTSILAERAHQLEARQPVSLDADQFVVHVLDVTEAAITAPSRLVEGGTEVGGSEP